VKTLAETKSALGHQLTKPRTAFIKWGMKYFTDFFFVFI